MLIFLGVMVLPGALAALAKLAGGKLALLWVRGSGKTKPYDLNVRVPSNYEPDVLRWKNKRLPGAYVPL